MFLSGEVLANNPKRTEKLVGSALKAWVLTGMSPQAKQMIVHMQYVAATMSMTA